MNFFTVSEGTEKPCRESLAHPIECFIEIFLATPAVVGTFLISTSGFLLALVIWVAIVAFVFYSIYALSRFIYNGLKCTICHTRIGYNVHAVARVIGSRLHLPRPACCRKAVNVEQTGERLVGDGRGSPLGNVHEVVSRMQPESRWKSPLKHLSFRSGPSSPSKQKTPKSSTKILNVATPKLLTPKAIK